MLEPLNAAQPSLTLELFGHLAGRISVSQVYGLFHTILLRTLSHIAPGKLSNLLACGLGWRAAPAFNFFACFSLCSNRFFFFCSFSQLFTSLKSTRL